MKQSLLFVLSFFGFVIQIQGQCPTNLWLKKQSEVDSFFIHFPGCDSVGGNLKISSIDITNLNGLNGLRVVEGDLELLDVYQLTTLSGFSSLERVGANLKINGSAALQNLEGFENLKLVDGSLFILSNYGLTSLKGLENLGRIGISLELHSNPKLQTLKSLDSLKSVGYFISIRNNRVLKSLEGLQGLKSNFASIYINSIDSLTDLHGLDSIRHLKGDFKLENLPNLKNLSALSNLDSAEAQLALIGCGVSDLSGLENFKKTNYLKISQNQNLTDINALQRLRDIVGVEVSYNPILTNLDGLSNLKKVGNFSILGEALQRLTQFDSIVELGSLHISSTHQLKNLNGLENVKTLRSLFLEYNAGLESLEGLSGLKKVDFLAVRVNAVLPNLAGLENVDSIGGMYIVQNAKMASLQGLNDSLALNGELEIVWNQKLELCHVLPVCRYLSQSSPQAEINNNGSPCLSVAAIVANCTTSSTIWDEQSADFQVFPNPISGEEDLKIRLGSAFSGVVKIEFLSLEGRVLQVLEKEKTTQNVFEVLNLGGVPNTFFVRVSDENTTATRLALKF